MKILLTEEQAKKLTDTLVNEQEDTDTGSLVNFFQKLVGGSDESTPNSDQSNSSTMPDLGSFSGDVNDMAKLVIDKLEGGYYHPDMLRDGRVKDSRYGHSGETMFGMDRKNGGDINSSSAGRQFWSLIDNANAKSTWKWNYGGGNIRPQLLQLASQMIIPQYNKYFNKYLSPQSQQIVKSDKGLTFNFLYGTWNGEGWFKKFAHKINDAVSQGITVPKTLEKIALDARSQSGNSLISQQTNQIGSIMNNLA